MDAYKSGSKQNSALLHKHNKFTSQNKLNLLTSLSLCIAISSNTYVLAATSEPAGPPPNQNASSTSITQEPDNKTNSSSTTATSGTNSSQIETSSSESSAKASENKSVAKSTDKPATKSTDTELAKGQIYTKGLGLLPAELHLLNQGRFEDLAQKLSAKVTNKPTRQAAWLAFAYLYLQKCDDLNKLVSSFTADETNKNDINLTLIKSFAFLCDKKTDLAEKELQSIPAAAMKDAFVNYAFATLSGKQNKPQVAIGYTKRAVEIAPDFAWGYRTIAFLQEKWLHQMKDAEENYKKALAIEPKLDEANTQLINMHLANNQFDEAIDIAKKAIAAEPRKGAEYCQLAAIYIQQWRLREASQQVKKALALEPDNSQYYRLLAFISAKESDFNQAIIHQKEAIDHSNDKSVDLFELAVLQLQNKQQAEAIDSLKQAIDANPENVMAISELTRISIQTGKFDDLLAQLNKCATKFPKNELIKLHLGDAYAAAKQPDKAIEMYKDAGRLNPRDAEPHTRVAALLAAKDDFEVAAKEYTHALNINPNSAANLVALGSCEAQMDDYLKAEAAFVTALALHQLTQPVDSTVPPTRIDIIRGLAALLYKEGRYADAASQFMAVIEMDKNPASASLDKFMSAQAIALRDLSKDSFKLLDDAYAILPVQEKSSQEINYVDTLLRCKRYDEALALLKEIAQAKDVNSVSSLSSPFYWVCCAQAYLGKGHLEKAQKSAQQALDICEKDKSPKSDVYCQLGEVLFAKDDFAGAEKNANNALEANPRAFRAYVLLGNIAMKQKQTKLAIEGANKALEIDPYCIEAYTLLGRAQMAQNDYKGALATYNKAIDLYPSLMETHESLLEVLAKIGTQEEITKEKETLSNLKSKR